MKELDSPELQDDTERHVAERLGRMTAASEADVAKLLDDVMRQAESDDLLDVAWAVTDTPVGPLTLAATPIGLVKIQFGQSDKAVEDLAEKISPRVLRLPQRLDAVRHELDEYFAGRRQAFDLPLDWRLARGFRLTVLNELVRGVPFGHTVSYKELATLAGNPKASRAAGSAMATNPIPIVVPCHRVLRSGGDIGYYGGGVEMKAWLLQHEGARLHPM